METVQNGYFAQKIYYFLNANNPDLLEDSSYVAELINRCIDRFIDLDIAGLSENEAAEQSLTQVFEGISSPYSVLKDFLDINRDKIEKVSGKVLVDSQVDILQAVKKYNKEIAAYSGALQTSDPEVIKGAAKLLVLAVLLELKNNGAPENHTTD